MWQRQVSLALVDYVQVQVIFLLLGLKFGSIEEFWIWLLSGKLSHIKAEMDEWRWIC